MINTYNLQTDAPKQLEKCQLPFSNLKIKQLELRDVSTMVWKGKDQGKNLYYYHSYFYFRGDLSQYVSQNKTNKQQMVQISEKKQNNLSADMTWLYNCKYKIIYQHSLKLISETRKILNTRSIY